MKNLKNQERNKSKDWDNIFTERTFINNTETTSCFGLESINVVQLAEKHVFLIAHHMPSLLPPLGESDHIPVYLQPEDKPLVHKQPAVIPSVKTWSYVRCMLVQTCVLADQMTSVNVCSQVSVTNCEVNYQSSTTDEDRQTNTFLQFSLGTSLWIKVWKTPSAHKKKLQQKTGSRLRLFEWRGVSIWSLQQKAIMRL